MDADIAERLKQCRIFFRKGKDWTDAEELTAARVFQDFRDFLINERERPYAWCAFQQTEEALAMLLSVEGLMTVCDSTWTQADAEQEFRPQLEQTVQALKKGRAGEIFVVDYRGSAQGLYAMHGEDELELRDGIGARPCRTRLSGNGLMRFGRLYPAEMMGALQEPPETRGIEVVDDERRRRRPAKRWEPRTKRRQAFLSALLGHPAEEIAWETDLLTIVVADPRQAERVFPYIGICYIDGPVVPLYEILSIDFHPVGRGRKGKRNGKMISSYTYPGFLRPFGGVGKEALTYVTYQRAVLQVAASLSTMERLRDDEMNNEVRKLVIWDTERIRIEQTKFDVLEAHPQYPILANCDGSYGLASSARRQDAACFGMTPAYLRSIFRDPRYLGSYIGCGSVEKRMAGIDGYHTEDAQAFLDEMRWLGQAGQQDAQQGMFRMTALSVQKRLEDEVRCLTERGGRLLDGRFLADGYAAAIEHLRSMFSSDDEVAAHEAQAVNLLEKLFLCLSESGGVAKPAVLRQLIGDLPDWMKNIVVLVPKAAWAEALADAFPGRRVSVLTTTKFDPDCFYDAIIACGRLDFEHVPIAWNARRFIFLLYPFEEGWYEWLMRRHRAAERQFDAMTGLGLSMTPSLTEIPAAEVREEAGSSLWADLEQALGRERQTDWAALWSERLQRGDAQAQQIVRIARLADDRTLFMTKGYRFHQVVMPGEEKACELFEVATEHVEPGMQILYSNSTGNRGELRTIIRQTLEDVDALEAAEAVVKRWKSWLREYVAHFKTFDELSRAFHVFGRYQVDQQTIQSWLRPHGSIIGPRSEEAYKAMGRLPNSPLRGAWKEAYEATTRVRRDYSLITEKISEGIPVVYQKLKNGEPLAKGDAFEQHLAAHMDMLANLFEIVSVEEADFCVPQGYANRPLDEEAVFEEDDEEGTDGEE